MRRTWLAFALALLSVPAFSADQPQPGDYVEECRCYISDNQGSAQYGTLMEMKDLVAERERLNAKISAISGKLLYTVNISLNMEASQNEELKKAAAAYIRESFPQAPLRFGIIDMTFQATAAELEKKDLRALLHKFEKQLFNQVKFYATWELYDINRRSPSVW